MIPEHLEDITADWLTEVLRTGGHLPEGKVTSVERRILGEGEGFLGVVARLTLAFEGAAAGAPQTLIAKLPTEVAENRVMGEMLGAYWREIHFYRELSGEMPVRVPRVFHADLTPDPMRERQDQIVRFLERLPAWLVRWLMNHADRLVKRNAHRYVLLIEDLAPAEVGDQVAGGSDARCGRALSTAAEMHAAFWQAPLLDEKFWFVRHTQGALTRHRMFLAARDAFEARHAALLDADARSVLDWLALHGEPLGKLLHTTPPKTLIHCDFRFDNLFFAAAGAGGEETVILGDWQLVGVGAAAYDVAYLLSGALGADVGADGEERLLRGYHARLLAGGVEGYDFVAFQRDYGRAMLTVLQILATTDEVDMGDARGVTLMERWVERTLARLRYVDLDALLAH